MGLSWSEAVGGGCSYAPERWVDGRGAFASPPPCPISVIGPPGKRLPQYASGSEVSSTSVSLAVSLAMSLAVSDAESAGSVASGTSSAIRSQCSGVD